MRWIFSLLAALCCLPAIAADDILTLHYHHRPPYQWRQDVHLAGLVGQASERLLHKAGIRFELAETPPARQLALIQSGQGLDCGVGWFKNPEREGFARFSKAIYRDAPLVVLSRSDNLAVRKALSLPALLARRDITLLVKKAYSYGALDALIARYQPLRQAVGVENQQMLKMIQARRADYLLLAPEEASSLIEQAGEAGGQLATLQLHDMPQGEQRYIMCSKAVPAEWLARLDALKP
ncbi:substrate-binding periplasmic protein [Chitinilyticum litopenaei]|uniref:substrate-binding periplasmic protein n=1 Tax=Chitinilyticum litopenaei TaxID=1121276 RepID=UPI000424078E|nr:transporter substrate-binding domain-containing protein [Chitinilyticum litopenaei]